jgi:RNA polymerase sigma-70 factor (ECF subfamily)
MTTIPSATDETSPDPPRPVDPLAALCISARAGDPAAARALLEALAPHVLAIVRMLFGPRDRDLEDRTQEILVAVWRSLESFRFESSVVHFARQIAFKRCYSAIRDRRAARRARTEEHDDLDVLPSDGPSPLDGTLAERRRAQWATLLARLPLNQSEAFVLHVVFGHTVEEIASAHGAPIETTRSRLRLAKSSIREWIATDPSLADLGEER